MRKLSDKQLRELENPETWEEKGEVHPAVKNPRAVVSVAFSRDDFGRVAEAARERGMKLSAFIREAAVERAERDGTGMDPASVTMSATQSGFIEGTFTTSAVVRWETDEKKRGSQLDTVTA
ncbi:MAG TPA: hypothetical protein VFI42_07135 [Thermomicrobiaceae bacterium]|nr:hypothetical protein [Thermomicrobiaceae bacterium]